MTCLTTPTRSAGLAVAVGFLACLSMAAQADGGGGGGGWPLHSHDYANTNHNPDETKLSPITAKYLKRAWETFNDDELVSEPRPTGFVLESLLGLEYPSAVVGVVASPIVIDGTIFYIDALGTIFARDARTGKILDPQRHWTTTLVDPDFDAGDPAVLPELIFTAPVVTDTHIWIAGSVNGRLHAVERLGGAELDFDPSTAEIDPYALVPDLPFASVLGDSVIVNTGPAGGDRDLYITGINVIVNDAVVQGEETGIALAIDITDPLNPVEFWRTFTIDIDPATGLRYGTGVSAGAGLAIDTERRLVLGGTGQNTTEPYPGYPDPDLAPAGYVDRSDSSYAIDYLSGEFIWNNQFHAGDVFNLNAPVSTGPDNPDGPRDADVLSPPVLWSAEVDGESRDLVGVGSKGGLYRVADRATGETVWERQISKPTGIGGIQAGSAYANGTVYVAGFEGLDDGFSDAQFGTSLETGKFPNAFFATFSESFWADVEDTRDDDDPATGMRIKLYALDAATGQSRWDFGGEIDFVELAAGAALRHVSVANGLIFVTSSSGTLFVLDQNGSIVFTDQTEDLNESLSLGLGKPHHASMNAGTVVSDGMVFVGHGAQNNPSGGMLAYEIDVVPASLDLLNTLHDDVAALHLSSDLESKLLKALLKAQGAIEGGPFPKAIAKLEKFIRNVDAAAGDHISPQDAESLIARAGAIIDLLDR